MDGRTLARIGAIVFAAIAITAAVIDMTRKNAPPPELSAPRAVTTDQRDPLDAELTRCSAAGEAATRDPACLKAWAENRRRFLGGTGGGVEP